MWMLDRAWHQPCGRTPGADGARRLSAAPLEWDGSPTGDFATRSLTDAQRQLLLALRCGETVTVVPIGARHAAPVPGGVAVHELTIIAALKHRYVQSDGSGHYRITNHGLRALKQLR